MSSRARRVAVTASMFVSGSRSSCSQPRVVGVPFSEPQVLQVPAKKVELKILRFPLTPKFDKTLAELYLQKKYTLKEANALTGLDESFFRRLAVKHQGDPEASSKDEFGRHSISGRLLVAVLNELNQIPENLVSTRRLSAAIPLSHTEFDRLLQRSDCPNMRFFRYPDSNGIEWHIPVYDVPWANGFFVDQRAFDFVISEQRKKCDRLEWKTVLRYLIRQKIDVSAASLMDEDRWIFKKGDREIFRYPLLSGEYFEMTPYRRYKRGLNPKIGKITYNRADILRFVSELRKEARIWIPYQDFLDTNNIRTFSAQVQDGYKFILDRQEYFFERRIREGCHVAFVQAAVGSAYLKHRELKNSKHHIRLFCAYRSMTSELTERRRLELERIREVRNGRDVFLVSSKYGIGVVIRTYGGNERVNTDNLGILQFYLTLKTADSRHVGKLINDLERDIRSPRVSFETKIKLWILRDHFMESHETDPNYSRILLFFRDRDANNNLSRQAVLMRRFNFRRISQTCRKRGKEIEVFTPDISSIFQSALAGSVRATESPFVDYFGGA